MLFFVCVCVKEADLQVSKKDKNCPHLAAPAKELYLKLLLACHWKKGMQWNEDRLSVDDESIKQVEIARKTWIRVYKDKNGEATARTIMVNAIASTRGGKE